MTKNTNALREQGTCDRTNISVFSIAHDERINPELCSGYGAYHSNKPGTKNPKPYAQIDFEGIRKLLENPQKVEKSLSQWLIPSTLQSRTFKEQEANGEYWALWADIDEDPPCFDRLVEVVKLIIDDHDFEAYTTSSATEQNQKARVIIPLGEPLCCVDWQLCQQVLNDQLLDELITPDRANERAAQLCYLPNRGEFYDSKSKREGKFFDPMSKWADSIKAKQDEIKTQAEELERFSKEAIAKREAASSIASPDLIGAFNEAYTVQDIMLQAGYSQRGNNFRHPNSESGSFSAGVKNGRVHSLSTKDPLYTDGGGIGAHDPFSTFTVLFCNGNRNKALIDADNEWLAINDESWSKAKNTAIISTAFEKLDSDIGAMHVPEVLAAFAIIYRNNQTEWMRIYQKLKKHRIASDVKKAVIVFLRKNKFKKSSTSNTTNVGNDLDGTDPTQHQHLSNTKPAIESSSLITLDDDTGAPTLIIESSASLKLKKALTGFFAYDINSQTWHEFTGSHWHPLDSQQSADSVLVSLLYTGAGALGFRPAYKNGIKLLLTDGDMLPLPITDSEKLPFNNGLLDLKTGQLEPITSNNAQTWCLPYEYNAKADCPAIKAWLMQAVDEDEETVKFLRAWMAAVLHGRSDLQKFLHLKGSGGTGKGVFMRLLTALVGERNTAITSLDQLEQNRFETATLYNKRLAVISDSDKYGGSINNLKAITGQDYIRLERKHQQQAGNFIFNGLVIMASNESLQVTDHTSGLDRRRITVIFDRRATDKEKQTWDKKGGEEKLLHSELPGLANWLLELSHDEISQIIRNPPDRIRRADLEAMTASNPIADWLTECCEPDCNAWTQIGDKREIREPGHETKFENADTWLYASFLQWCQRTHKTPLAVRRFREIVKQSCTTLDWSVSESRRSEGMGINGLRIKETF